MRIELPTLRVLPELMRLPELEPGALAPAETDVLFVLVEPDADGVCVRIELPTLRVLLELMRLPELVAGALAPAETDVLFVLVEPPIREPIELLELSVDCLLEPDVDGVRAVIELPTRSVLPELMRLPELAAGALAPAETDVLFVLVEPPIREPIELLELSVDWLLEPDVDGVRAVIELPILSVLLELMRPVEPGVVRLLWLELVPIDLPVVMELEGGR